MWTILAGADQISHESNFENLIREYRCKIADRQLMKEKDFIISSLKKELSALEQQ